VKDNTNASTDRSDGVVGSVGVGGRGHGVLLRETCGTGCLAVARKELCVL